MGEMDWCPINPQNESIQMSKIDKNDGLLNMLLFNTIYG